MTDDSIQQFKMSNGDEIICTIEEYGDGDFIVKAALKMVEIPFDFEDSQRGFVFRPWMNYQDDIEKSVVLNAISIVAFYEPSEFMKKGYLEAVDEVREYFETEYKTEIKSRKRKAPKTDDSSNVVSLFDEVDGDHSIH